MEVTGILPRNIVASASNARAGAEGQEGKVTGILPGNSNVASVSNAGAEARVVEKEKNNNKSKVQNMDGVELFPPAGSKMRKTSDAWRYGGLKKNEKGKLLTDKMYCALCPKTFKYNQSPSALSDHLKHCHRDKMLELETAKEQSQSRLLDFRFVKTNIQEQYKASHPKQKAFRTDVGDWVIKDKRPFSIVNDWGFRKAVKTLDARIKVPSDKTISDDIKVKYAAKKKVTIEKLKQIDFFSCTNDG